jgi:hypothetical protein
LVTATLNPATTAEAGLRHGEAPTARGAGVVLRDAQALELDAAANQPKRSRLPAQAMKRA